MSKKQTLKSLLGGSDDRVQVSYDPSEITLSPTVQQARGSTTVVQSMPQTNQALNFAKALNQAPQVLGQMKQIGQAQAIEDFNQITDDERKDKLLSGEEELSGFRMLGYNQAFQRELVKDYFVRNTSSISERFTKLAADPSQYTSEEDFKQAINNEKQALISELGEQFGNDPIRVEALNAIGNSVLTEVVKGTNELYEANLINGIVSHKATNLQATIKANGDISGGFTTFLEEVKLEANLSNPEAKEELLATSLALANSYSLSGQYEKSLEIIDNLKNYEFFKGAKYGGDDLNKIINLEDEIRKSKDNASNVNVNNAASQIRSSFSFVSIELSGYGKGENIPQKTYNQVSGLLDILRPNLPQEAKLELLSRLDNSELSAPEKIETLKNILTEAGTLEFKGAEGEVIGVPDNTSSIFNLASQGFVDYFAQAAVQRPWMVNGLSDQQKQNAVTGALDWFKLPNNRHMKPNGYMETIGYPGAKIPQGVQDAYDEARQLDWMEGVNAFENFNEGSLKAYMNNSLTLMNFGSSEVTKTALKRWDEFVAANADSYFPLIENDLEEYATTIIDDENRDELLTKKITELKEYYSKNLSSLFEASVNSASYLQYGREATRTNNPELARRTGVLPSEFVTDINEDKGTGFSERTGGDFDDLPVNSSERFVEQSIENIGKTDIKQYPHLMFLNSRMTKEQYAYKNVDEFQEIYSQMRSDNDILALQATMVAYGYPTFDTKSADDLRRTGLSYYEVRLFGTEPELRQTVDGWVQVFNKFSENEMLNDEERMIFDTLTSYGIYDNKSALEFFNVQLDLVNRF